MSRNRAPGPTLAIGVDTGGTFTDFVAVIGDRLVALKLPSTPRAPERAVLEGLRRLAAGPSTRVRHGSTVATNTLLERKGARVAFLTTEGFEDLLEIGRQDRPDIYSLAPRRVAPLVPREQRIGVRERIGPLGERWIELDAAAVRAAARAAAAARPEALAVGLLHAYADPDHERRLGRALRRLGLPVTLSSELCPEVREYERFSTTVANAYLAPRLSAYLGALARALGHAPSPSSRRRTAASRAARPRAAFEVVLSHGGTAPVELAAREPVRQLLSGPAAGLSAARDVAASCGFRRALTLDVGGTSTDCAYLDGALPRRRAREVAGFPIQLPMLDVHTIGAGGGSIARVDAGGLLHVGPESAGASPGPACYGHGGPATVTDALVVMGRIPHDRLAGGRLTLDRGAARRALGSLARRLGAGDAQAAAAGVVRVAEARMAEALRRVSVERGHDPRGAALVAFGGAGGLHATGLAEALECRAVVFPRHAGLLCAIGALAGGSRRERSRSVMLAAGDHSSFEPALAELERSVRDEFPAADRPRVEIERWAEARYRGQSHELSLPYTRDLAERFHREHQRRFGFATPDLAVEVVTLDVRGTLGSVPLPVATGWMGRADAGREAGDGGSTRVFHADRWLRAAWFDRTALAAGARIKGPAIVLEEGATLWIGPGWQARLHTGGALVVTR